MFDPSPYLKATYVPGGRRWPLIDCWGLVCAVFQREANIELDPWDTTPCGDVAAFAAAAVSESKAWEEVPLAELRSFDVLLFSLGRPAHCGVIIQAQTFLHAREGAGICVAALTDQRQPWRASRLFAAYRHPKLARS